MNQINSYREQRALSREDFLLITGAPSSVLDPEFDIDSLSSSTKKKVAGALGVPEFSLGSKRARKLNALPRDFRTTGNARVHHSLYSLSSIYKTYSINSLLDTVAGHLDFEISENIDEIINSDTAPLDKMRFIFGVESGDIQDEIDPSMFFDFLRFRAEDRGLFVLSDLVKDGSFRGFCQTHRHRHYVFINKQHFSMRSRIFTLAHEVAHLALGRPGVVDPLGRDSGIERRTNKLAARFLLPSSALERYFPKNAKNYDPVDLVDYFFERLPFSKHFIAIRIQEVGDEFSGFADRWLRTVNIQPLPLHYDAQDLDRLEHELDDEDVRDEDEGQIRRQGSGARQVSRLGSNALLLFQQAVRSNLVSAFDVQAFTGLPAKNLEKAVSSLRRKRAEVDRNVHR